MSSRMTGVPDGMVPHAFSAYLRFPEEEKPVIL